ncbi:protein kinase [Myxococcota bacterium]|nr:protein kinase [Myxococcota bacterium]
MRHTECSHCHAPLEQIAAHSRFCPVCRFPLDPVEGGFVLEKLLLKTAMSSLYLASPPKDSDLPHPCVLKFPHPSLWTREGSEERIREDLAKINGVAADCSQIVWMDRHLHQDPVLGPFFVMEHLEGRTLREWLTEYPSPTPKQLFSLVFQLCQALEALHRGGGVHRDLQPNNIFVLSPETESLVIKLLDFGLAKPNAGSDGGDFTQGVVGSPYYLSPEQCLNQEVAVRSDLYALGVILYELLAQRWPFGEKPEDIASSLFTTLHAHVSVPPEPLRVACPDRGFAEDLDRVVMKLLAKAPEDRFARAEELWSALAQTPIFEGEATTPAMLLSEDRPPQTHAEAEVMPSDRAFVEPLVVEPEVPAAVRVCVHRYEPSQRPRWISGWLMLFLGTCAGASMWSLAPEGRSWWEMQARNIKTSVPWVPSWVFPTSPFVAPPPKALVAQPQGKKPTARTSPLAAIHANPSRVPRRPESPSLRGVKHLAEPQHTPPPSSIKTRMARRARAVRKRRARSVASASLDRPKPTTQQAEPASRPRSVVPSDHETKIPNAQQPPTEDIPRLVRTIENAPSVVPSIPAKDTTPIRLPSSSTPSLRPVALRIVEAPSALKDGASPSISPSASRARVSAQPILPSSSHDHPSLQTDPETPCGSAKAPCKKAVKLTHKEPESSPTLITKKPNSPTSAELPTQPEAPPTPRIASPVVVANSASHPAIPATPNKHEPPSKSPSPTSAQTQPALARSPKPLDAGASQPNAAGNPQPTAVANAQKTNVALKSKNGVKAVVAASTHDNPHPSHSGSSSPSPQQHPPIVSAQTSFSSKSPVLGLSVMAGMRILPLIPQQLVRLIFPTQQNILPNANKATTPTANKATAPTANNPDASAPHVPTSPKAHPNLPLPTPCSASTRSPNLPCPSNASQQTTEPSRSAPSPEKREGALLPSPTLPLGGALERPSHKSRRAHERFHAQHRLFEAFLFPQHPQRTETTTQKHALRYFLPFSQRWVALSDLPVSASDAPPSVSLTQEKSVDAALLRLESCAARMFLLLRTGAEDSVLNAAVLCVLAQKDRLSAIEEPKKKANIREFLASAYYLHSLRGMRQILQFAWEENFDKEPSQGLEEISRLSNETAASLQQIIPLEQPLWSSCARFRGAQTKAWLSWRIRGFLDSALFGHRLTPVQRKHFAEIDARLRREARLLFRDAVRADLDAGVEHVCAQRSLLGLHLLREPALLLPKSPR